MEAFCDETGSSILYALAKDGVVHYDNRAKCEVDFLINDYDSLSVLPIEVKSGRDYQIHSSISNMTKEDAYGIGRAVVLSSDPNLSRKGKIIYLPVYDLMFL